MMKLEKQWEKQKLWFEAKTVEVGPLFNSSSCKILFGTTDGKVVVYNNGAEESVLESKGGGITTLVLKDILRLNSVDLLCGDVQGTLTIFSKGEIVARHAFNDPVTSVTILESSSTVMVGHRSGNLNCVRAPFDHLWTIRTNDDETYSSIQSSRSGSAISEDPSIRCMISTTLTDKFGVPSNLLLVCNATPFIHFYNGTQRVHSVSIPSKVNALCSGIFQKSKQTPQVVAGCEDGFIYLVEDFNNSKKFINVGYPITLIRSHVFPVLHKSTSAILCSGHFDALKVYFDGQLMLSYKTSDWVHSFAVGDVDNDGEEEIVLALMNKQVVVSKFAFHQQQSTTLTKIA